MTAPRSRKRLAKLHRAAAIGCCLAATAASAAGAMDVPHHVTPNNAPRRSVEKRRRVEHEYYRQLAQKQQEESFGEADAANHDVEGDGRRLGGDNTASIHDKGKEYSYTPVGVHKKGNKESSEDEQPMQYTALGSQSANGNNESANKPTGIASGQSSQSNVDGGEDDSKSDLRAATNLRSFTRIAGQGYALPDEKRYPYMASLQLEGHSPSAGKYDIHMCGAILVAPDIIMTAAHCANYSPPGTDETHQAFNGIEIGKTDLNFEGVKFDPYSLDTYKLYYENLVPDKLHLHPQFKEDTYEHDVMLVKVFGKSRFPPVKVANGNSDITDQVVTVLGWGADSANSKPKYSNQLKSAQLDLMSDDQCRNVNVEVKDPVTQKTSTMSLRDHVHDDMMCAKSQDRYICYGDAGGPALHSGANSDEDEVLGIVSWGYGCVNSNYPAVLTKVSENYDWIKRTICNESSDPPEQYGCSPKGMTTLSYGTQVVTLKLKLDKMAVESGFVVEVQGTGEIVAQRQTGYYKSEGNEIVLETMELPRDTCYNLILLDAYGDGMCCHLGGGNGILYWGTDVGYYTGQALVEVSGNFEFDNSGAFCLNSPGNTITAQSNNPPPTRRPSPPTPRTPRPTPKPTPRPNKPSSSNFISSGSLVETPSSSSSGWSGPVTNPEYEYCTQICTSSSGGMMCGKFACVVNIADEVATSDSQADDESDTTSAPVVTPAPVPAGPIVSEEFYDDDSAYYLTVQIQFDDGPEEISWVLYDLTTNEVQVFVDFGAYPKEDYANKLLNILVTMDGPEEGEKQYAFTVYDKASNGLCCDHGEGYYKVFLGDVEDELELLGDEEFDFSSSYYFTLFESEEDDEPPTASPTLTPSKDPSRRPTKKPTRQPTKQPTQQPSTNPTTVKPTNVWEVTRQEDMSAIGARWNMRKPKTPPGVFNDVGGDQVRYKFNADGSLRNAADVPRDSVRISFVAGISVIVFALLQ